MISQIYILEPHFDLVNKLSLCKYAIDFDLHIIIFARKKSQLKWSIHPQPHTSFLCFIAHLQVNCLGQRNHRLIELFLTATSSEPIIFSFPLPLPSNVVRSTPTKPRALSSVWRSLFVNAQISDEFIWSNHLMRPHPSPLCWRLESIWIGERRRNNLRCAHLPFCSWMVVFLDRWIRQRRRC